MENADMLVVSWALYDLAEKGFITEEIRQDAAKQYLHLKVTETDDEITSFKTSA